MGTKAFGDHLDWASKMALVIREHCVVSADFSIDSERGLPWNPSEPTAWAAGHYYDVPTAVYKPVGAFDTRQVVTFVRDPFTRLLSSFKYYFHDINNVKDPVQHGARDSLIKGAPSPAVFFALHACAVQTRFLSGALARNAFNSAHVYSEPNSTLPKDELPPCCDGAVVDTFPTSSRQMRKLQGRPAEWRASNRFARQMRAGCSAAALEEGIFKLRRIQQAGRDSEGLWKKFVAERRHAVQAWMAGPAAALIVSKAVHNLEQFAFVGITDDWAASICVFHRLFGGEPSSRTLGAVRVQPHDDYGELGAELRKARVIDTADEKVYSAALERFQEVALRVGCRV